MISPRDSSEFDPDVVALDAALDTLAGRRPVAADPVLAALATLAHVVDARAAALGRTIGSEPSAQLNGSPASRNGRTIGWGWQAKASHPASHPSRTGPAGSKGRRRALLAIAAAAVIAVTGAVPFSTSPRSPLYPLHQLIFQPDDRAAVDHVRLSLVNANQALDQATGNNGATRVADLDQARRHLADARKQLDNIGDADEKAELERQLSTLEQRASRLAEDNEDNEDQGSQDGRSTASPRPTDDSQGNQGQANDTNGQH